MGESREMVTQPSDIPGEPTGIDHGSDQRHTSIAATRRTTRESPRCATQGTRRRLESSSLNEQRELA